MSLLGTVEDTVGVSLRDLFDIYKDVNQVKIDRSFNDSQNFINELNAKSAVELNRLQNERMLAEQQANNRYQTLIDSLSFNRQTAAASVFDLRQAGGWLLIGGGVLAAIYLARN